jgi:hypothetical protein
MHKDLALGLVLAVILVTGLLFEIYGGDGGRTSTSAPAAASESLFERATYCPDLGSAAKRVSASVTFSSTSEKGAHVQVVRQGSGTFALQPHDIGHKNLARSHPGPVNVIAYGAPVAAAESFSATEPVKGSGATSCLSEASESWYLPAGSSSLDTKEDLLLYNPFSNDAAVKISFYTTTGVEESANLSNVGVAASPARTIDIDRYAKPRATVGISAEAVRGRILAWSNVAYKGGDHQASGYALASGVTAPRTNWYIPDTSVGPRSATTVVLMNSSTKEAVVDIGLTSTSKPVAAPRLAGIKVPPKSVTGLDLAGYLPRSDKQPGGLSVTLSSANGVPFCAQATTTYSGNMKGVVSDVAAATPARRVVLQPPESGPQGDVVVVMNPSQAAATVDVSLDTGAGRATPKRLQGLKVPAGLRARIPLTGEIDHSGRTAVEVVSSAPVTAARIAYPKSGGDAAEITGMPLAGR